MDIFSNELFGVALTLMVYVFAQKLRRTYKSPLFNPVFVSTVLIIAILLIIRVPYEDYFKGGRIISFFVAPATVVLAMPLYKNRKVFFDNLIPILSGVTFGVIGSLVSTAIFAKVFDLSDEIAYSIMPHSVTTAIATDLVKTYNGIESLTVASVIVTGIVGAIVGPIIFDKLGLKNHVAQGIALGTASHAVGTARALELGEKQGAMSSVAIVLAGILTTILMPIVMSFM